VLRRLLYYGLEKIRGYREKQDRAAQKAREKDVAKLNSEISKERMSKARQRVTKKERKRSEKIAVANAESHRRKRDNPTLVSGRRKGQDAALQKFGCSQKNQRRKRRKGRILDLATKPPEGLGDLYRDDCETGGGSRTSEL